MKNCKFWVGKKKPQNSKSRFIWYPKLKKLLFFCVFLRTFFQNLAKIGFLRGKKNLHKMKNGKCYQILKMRQK